jgi:hypothetical protein
MSTPTELIFVGNCKQLIDNFNICNKAIIKKEDIKVKGGTVNFKYASQEWGYYPITFECKDNIEGPNGNFTAGDFLGSYGYMRKY